ncbi:inner membrane transporter RhtA [Arcanobacterium wilhelmae]|uniref:Inner membrane transporter RhtA n=1 Tax=Arcanobacterium wilhelmae TaxID=1803177 RepID=A0ABT9NCS8_9ACTO|nr:EamA family transporter [Arcanobacterium wilhelmae]MDP9801533.1 inner membrane transporter RhtA [Arcanobacterium wilhelmae]WFN90860.1 EamA family transporter [Arcanobacterium wilhelmae]
MSTENPTPTSGMQGAPEPHIAHGTPAKPVVQPAEPPRLPRHERNFVALFAPAIVISSAIMQYVGASIAVQLFAAATVGAVAWGRFSIAGIVLAAIRRPKIPWCHPRQAWLTLRAPAAFGLALTTMNVVFYYAISLIHLGTAVALEFLGPVVLAALTGRSIRERVGIGFALAGVFLISWVGVDLSAPGQLLGVLLALFAGLFWALYIWTGRKVSTGASGPDALAIGFCAGALAYLPLAIIGFGPILTDYRLLAMMIGVAVLSSLLPFLLDVLLFKHIPTSTYSLISSLFPATSMLVGVALLGQIPTPGELVGLGCITVAVALARG